MKKPIFTKDHIASWYAEMEKLPPSISDQEWPDFPQADAFRGGVLTAGVALRFRNADGTTSAMRLSPVMARELAHWLMDSGQKAGWLDERFNVISPLADYDG